MKYEISPNAPAEDAAIIARIMAGETVYGAFLRGTGKIYMSLPIQVIKISEGENAGKLALSAGMNTHNGQIQAQFSAFVCEWCDLCERANEINRGAPMTEAEKAEMKRRRQIGYLAANLENCERSIKKTEDYIAYIKSHTPREYLLRPKAEGGSGWEPETADRIEANEPGWIQARYDSRIEMELRQIEYSRKEIAKLLKKQAALNK